MNLLLKGLRWKKRDQSLDGDIRIQNGFIREIDQNLKPKESDQVIEFGNHFIYPSLINSHDHLEMNLYPKMGSPPYPNYVTWGNDIYKPTESPIKEIEKVSLKDRLLWGGLKNLISGVTAVVHHNPWNRFLASPDFQIHVIKKYAWSHSLEFGKNLVKAFPKDNKKPYIIHAAEGVDELARSEVTKLHNMGLLKSNTIIVHGVAMTDDQIELVTKTGASLVWCPASNFFMFGKTASIEKWRGKVKFALGSDSTLTGSATLLDEMKFAISTNLATAQEIFHCVTSTPATIFSLPSPEINSNTQANILVMPVKHLDYFQNLVHGAIPEIELVLKNGQVKMCSDWIASQLSLKSHFISVDGNRKWTAIDVHALKKRIEKKAGNVLDANPLWKFIRAEE